MAIFKVRDGNNMPLQAPLIPDPFVPYRCPRNATVSVVCRTDKSVLERYLAPTPFAPQGDLYAVYVSDFSNCDKVPYMDGGIILPVTFEGRAGGTYLFEYEDDDRAIAAGRDLWGYPKKYGAFTMQRDGDIVSATITRHGTEILAISCDLGQPRDVPDLAITPHFNIHTQPAPDGTILSRRVIERDTSPDFKLISKDSGAATAKLAGLPQDPLDEFTPAEVLGGTYVVGDFLASETHGWGRTIADLV